MKQSGNLRWPILLAALAVLLFGASGCTGVQPTNWTGVILFEGVLYAADLQQARALDAGTGEVLWSFPEDPSEDRRGTFYATPATDGEIVVVASQVPPTGFLSQATNVAWGLNAETGDLVWRFDGAEGPYVEGGAIGQDTFVVGNGDGRIYALDVESGDIEWAFETGHRVWATPLIISDTVYIGSLDRHLYALDLADGDVRWDFAGEGAFASTPALRNGTLHAGAFDNRLYAIDASEGTERWQFEGENWFWGSPVVHGGVVYAVDVKGSVHALDAESGEEIWQQTLDTPVRAGPTLTGDGGHLFIGSEEGVLYALDTSDGYVQWSAETEGQLLSTSVVSGTTVYGTVLFGPQPHVIRALHVENGREIWAYPEETD